MLIPSSPHSCLQMCSDEKLIYRGEGNSSLVIALKVKQKVIRLLKADAKQLTSDDSDIVSHLRQHIQFVENVIACLVGECFFTVPQLIRLSESQIKSIAQLVADKRPRFRLDKSISCTAGDTFALLLPDYCCLPKWLSRQTRADTCGPVIAVEIKVSLITRAGFIWNNTSLESGSNNEKPKQGFLPEANVLSDELEIKSRVCRYCLKQFHKLKKGSISQISAYCPLDLFSGCADRMQTALMALIDNPQNNFRVFRDIQLEFGEDSTSASALSALIQDFIPSSAATTADCTPTAEESTTKTSDELKCRTFCRLLATALTLPLDSKRRSALVSTGQQTHRQQNCSLHSNAQHKCHCEDREHALPLGSVLETILSAQKLDSIDSELAARMFQLVTLMDNNNDMESALRCQTVPQHFQCSERMAGESELNYYSRKIWQFVVSLTAKDCSVMIAMQRLAAENRDCALDQHKHVICDQTSGHMYVVSVAITDLDQKPPHKKIARTLNNDRRMIGLAHRHLL